MELNKEQNIDALTVESDSSGRINKQSLFAILGSFILATTLWYDGWQQNPFVMALVGISLLVTPGLAIDGLIYAAMKRPVGSTLGNMIITGMAWYAGSISLGLTLGQPFNIVNITGMTLAFSLVAVAVTLFSGGLKTSKLVNKKDFKYLVALLMSIILGSSILVGSGYVFMNKNVLQPTGALNSMTLVSYNEFTKINPHIINGSTGELDVRFESGKATNDLLVEFTPETGTKASIFTTVGIKEVSKVKTPSVIGCGYIKIINKTTGQFIDKLYVKDYAYTRCETVVVSDIFERFEIDLSGAPTDSLKDLLKFAEEQLVKGNLDNLPQEYKDCIKQDDPNLVMECIDSV